jgi:quinoprotein glucose dehydrogenase
MLRKVFRLVPAVALLAIALVWVMSSPTVSGQASPQPSLKAGDWPMYTAALNGSKYSPLDQIGATNFSKLEMAWQFKTDNLGNTPESKLQGAPIAIRGTLFTTAGQNGKAVISLDGRNGELLWVHRFPEGERATRWSPRRYSGRGVAYWTDGKGDERIVYITTGYQLIELNAKTGQPVASFGRNGVVDLKVGVMIGKDKQIDLEKGEIAQHAPPVVVGDVILVGSSMFEGLGYQYSTNAKGVARAYDARTGKMLWRFDTVPKPGEFGNNTWENGSWEWTGNNGIWAIITVDPEAGLVYLPVETPTIDEYGGNRPGDNLFAESLVCVDLKTGKRKWHFQLVHHPLWDHDISSAPLLIDATIDGKPRKLVAQPTKQGWLYTFDRITGQPIWPIEERPVPQSDVPFEKTAATQPFVTKPPAYSPNYLATDRVIDFTPALRTRALENLKAYRWEQTPFIPPTYLGPGKKWEGAINIGNTGGGVNWPGASFDPETAIFYAQAGHTNVTTSNYSEAEINRISPAGQTNNGKEQRKPRWEADPNYGARGGARGGRAGTPVAEGARGGARTGGPGQAGARGGARGGAEPAAAAAGGGRAGGRGAAPEAAAGGRGGGRGGLTAGLEGLPIIKPPYGVLAAIDMNTGTMKFMVPHGDTPDQFKQTFQKLGINYPEKTGQGGSTGLMVTKTMVVVPDLQPTTGPGRTTPAAMLRAYDKQTGKEIGAIALPGRASGTPMTYMIDGRQYINIAIGGIGSAAGTYVTYALPMSEIRPAGPPAQ